MQQHESTHGQPRAKKSLGQHFLKREDICRRIAMIHARTLTALEFHRIAEHLASLCLSGVGRERAQAIAPLENADAVTLAARIYEEAADWASRPATGGAVFCVCSFPDVSGLLRAAAVSRAHAFQPDVDAFWALREVLRLARDAHASIAQPEAPTRWPHLLAMADGSPLPAQLTAALLRCISDDGLLRDESSPELYRLRGELRRLHQSCMDVLTLHQFGYDNAVGVLGTALTPEQIKRLSGFASQMTLLFDGDRAGRKAALRSCEMLLTRGLSCSVVIMDQLSQLAQGKEVRLVAVDAKGKDHYGRIVADVVLPDGRSLSDTLVRNGAAFVYPHSDLNPHFLERLRKFQHEAIAARRGLWAHLLTLPAAKKTYLGNRESMRFFPTDCAEVQHIKPRNRVFFGTLMDAFMAGYAPARPCNFWPTVK